MMSWLWKFLIVLGFLIVCFPYLYGFFGQQLSLEQVKVFYERVEAFELKDDLYHEMVSYNEQLYLSGQQLLLDPFAYEVSRFDLTSFGVLDDVIGVIRIPKIDVELPIYLGATKEHLNLGAVQLGETSLPIGGEHTNSVIAGHRGWYGKTLFKDIDQLALGDVIYIENLLDTLVYEVEDIVIIEPDDVNQILIQENRDLITLMSCHPYGKNTQRYLVYATRLKE